MNRFGLLLIAGIVSLATGFIIAGASEKSKSLEESATVGMHGNWVSESLTLEELYLEADLVVRARVTEQDGRMLEYTLPAYEVDSFPQDVPIGAPSEQYAPRQVGERDLTIPLTDSRLELLEIYKGNSEHIITVMQMGGALTSETSSDNNPEGFIEDDPLYSLGAEVVLFLVDISGDAVHAPSRTLYRIVNPAGRYDIQGERIFTPADPELLSLRGVSVPNTLHELETQLQELRRKYER